MLTDLKIIRFDKGWLLVQNVEQLVSITVLILLGEYSKVNYTEYLKGWRTLIAVDKQLSILE